MKIKVIADKPIENQDTIHELIGKVFEVNEILDDRVQIICDYDGFVNVPIVLNLGEFEIVEN